MNSSSPTWPEVLTAWLALYGAGVSTALGVLTLRDKVRTLKVKLRWGIDPEYQKTTGIVLWIYMANVGYQPLILHGARLHVEGIADDLTLWKPLLNKQFPMALQAGEHFATSISSEVLIEMVRVTSGRSKLRMNTVIETVFKEYRSQDDNVDVGRLDDLVKLVKDSEGYSQFKDFLTPTGGISMRTFADLDKYLRTIVSGGFTVHNIPELAEGESVR